MLDLLKCTKIGVRFSKDKSGPNQVPPGRAGIGAKQPLSPLHQNQKRVFSCFFWSNSRVSPTRRPKHDRIEPR